MNFEDIKSFLWGNETEDNQSTTVGAMKINYPSNEEITDKQNKEAEQEGVEKNSEEDLNESTQLAENEEVIDGELEEESIVEENEVDVEDTTELDEPEIEIKEDTEEDATDSNTEEIQAEEIQNQDSAKEDELIASKESSIEKSEKGGENEMSEEEATVQECSSCQEIEVQGANLQQGDSRNVPFCCTRTVSNDLTIDARTNKVKTLVTPCLNCVKEPCTDCPEVNKVIIRGCIPFILNIPATDPEKTKGVVCCEGEVCVDQRICFDCPENPKNCPSNPSDLANISINSVTVEECDNGAAQTVTVEGQFRLRACQ